MSNEIENYWNFDETTWATGSATVLDSSGNDYHGTPYADAASTSTAKYGRAGTFDGSGDDYVESGFNTSNVGNSNTVMAWIFLNTHKNHNKYQYFPEWFIFFVFIQIKNIFPLNYIFFIYIKNKMHTQPNYNSKNNSPDSAGHAYLNPQNSYRQDYCQYIYCRPGI